jgi:hypothetical protein
MRPEAVVRVYGCMAFSAWMAAIFLAGYGRERELVERLEREGSADAEFIADRLARAAVALGWLNDEWVPAASGTKAARTDSTVLGYRPAMPKTQVFEALATAVGLMDDGVLSPPEVPA